MLTKVIQFFHYVSHKCGKKTHVNHIQVVTKESCVIMLQYLIEINTFTKSFIQVLKSSKRGHVIVWFLLVESWEHNYTNGFRNISGFPSRQNHLSATFIDRDVNMKVDDSKHFTNLLFISDCHLFIYVIENSHQP